MAHSQNPASDRVYVEGCETTANAKTKIKILQYYVNTPKRNLVIPHNAVIQGQNYSDTAGNHYGEESCYYFFRTGRFAS